MSSFNQRECLWCGQLCDGLYCTCQQCGVVLTNRICLNCTYGDGNPITCWECEGPLRGGFCLFCNLKAENSFTYDPDSFNDTSSNFNHLPQPQYETYLCELCGNDSHYGYDCQPQFLFVYEQEPSYNQNYNDNYYPHDLSSCLCCDNCGGSHETFHCQLMDQNNYSSGFDQIQPPRYPVIHHPAQEMSEEVLQAKGNLMKSIQTFLEKFNCISFREMPKEYLENSNAIAAMNFNQEKEEPSQNSDIRQLIIEECGIKVCKEQKQNIEDTMLELLEVCQQKELYCMHNDVDDLIESALNSKLLSINLRSQRLNKEKQEVKNIVEQPTERGTRIVESLHNFRVKKSSTSLNNNTSQISPVNAITPVLPTEEPEYSLSMGYEHFSTTPETKSDEIIKSSVEKLVPIQSEYEGIFDNTSDLPVCEDHSEILSDSNNDDTSSDDDAFEDIKYVEASLSDSEFVSLEEENVVYQEEKEFDLEDILQIQDVILREKLLSINRLITDIEFLNDNPTPDCVINDHTEETRSGSTTAYANNSLLEYDSFCFKIEPDQGRLTRVVMNDISDNSTNDPLLKAVNLFLVSDNSIPSGIENFDYDSEGDIYFLEKLLFDDSFPLPKNESSNFEHHDDLSFPRPPPKPPDVEFFFDFEPNSGELISVVKNNIDELTEDECFDSGGEIDVFTNIEDDDYLPFIFVIRIFLSYLVYPEVSPLLLSTRSEDAIFDPGISN
uniref:Pre-mRNA splicing Prp18-interacting factor n=1 Tax=Tanacetum cinerariifolium TaxID=118510 RepID=A0A6L2LSJ4_TANCI|nr:hypothetical protein [Tanacetum cinerariifolium]